MLSHSLQAGIPPFPGHVPPMEKARDRSKVVYMVTDDEQLHTEIRTLVAPSGVRLEWFRSASGYLTYRRPAIASCLLISWQLEDMSGLELQRRLMGTIAPPIILLSERLDIPSCVRAIKEGAHDFFTLPLIRAHLLDAMHAAFERDHAATLARQERDDLRKRWRSLTSREAEVMRYAVGGLLNKQTASEMNITENTVQVHRGRAMRKMCADSFAEFVRMSLKLAEWGENSLLTP